MLRLRAGVLGQSTNTTLRQQLPVLADEFDFIFGHDFFEGGVGVDGLNLHSYLPTLAYLPTDLPTYLPTYLP